MVLYKLNTVEYIYICIKWNKYIHIYTYIYEYIHIYVYALSETKPPVTNFVYNISYSVT